MLFADRYEAGRFLALHKVIVPGATHLFEEPGMLEKAADLAKNGFITHVAKPSERNEAAELDQPRDRGANPENRLELFMADAPRMTVEELKRRMDAGENFTIVDVRNPQAWEQSATKIPGAIRVPMDHWEEKLPQIPKDRPVVTYCTWPNEASSASLAQKLQERGYKNAWALKGGFDAWLNAGFPVEPKRSAA